MFGIGGGELVLYCFIVLMLLVRIRYQRWLELWVKAMAQLKHATNDIKSEIQKVLRLMVLMQNLCQI
jgi:sec-independent protein translocase protein TatA